MPRAPDELLRLSSLKFIPLLPSTLQAYGSLAVQTSGFLPPSSARLAWTVGVRSRNSWFPNARTETAVGVSKSRFANWASRQRRASRNLPLGSAMDIMVVVLGEVFRQVLQDTSQGEKLSSDWFNGSSIGSTRTPVPSGKFTSAGRITVPLDNSTSEDHEWNFSFKTGFPLPIQAPQSGLPAEFITGPAAGSRCRSARAST